MALTRPGFCRRVSPPAATPPRKVRAAGAPASSAPKALVTRWGSAEIYRSAYLLSWADITRALSVSSKEDAAASARLTARTTTQYNAEPFLG